MANPRVNDLDPVEKFPSEVMVYLIVFLDAKSAGNAHSVSRKWKTTIEQPIVWKQKLQRIGLEIKNHGNPKQQYNEWAQQYQLKRPEKWALVGSSLGEFFMANSTHTDITPSHAVPGYYETLVFYFFPNSAYAEQLRIERAREHLESQRTRESDVPLNVGKNLGSLLGFFAGAVVNMVQEAKKTARETARIELEEQQIVEEFEEKKENVINRSTLGRRTLTVIFF
jgi:hypothetical protein